MGESGIGSFALFTEQVDATIVREMQPRIVYPDITRRVGVDKGNVREYNKMTEQEPIALDTVSEGAEFNSEVIDYDRYVVAFDEIGTAPRISKRLIEDAEWDVVQIMLEEIGFAAAKKANRDCLETLRAGVPTSSPDNSVAATALWSAADADPLRDISLGLETIEAQNYGTGRKTVIMHPEAFAYLRLDPNISRVMNYGDATVLKNNKPPQLYDTNIMVTTDLATHTGYSSIAKTMLLGLNADFAMNYYERQPLKTEQVDVAKSRAIDIVTYMRYAFAVIRDRATFQVTGVVS